MKFSSPLKVMASKTKSWILNLNQYRNTYFRTLNTVKINYKLAMEKQIKPSPSYDKIGCMYTVFPASKRSFDLGNVCCIHQKFFEDALVEYGKLPDDNINRIPLTIYMFGEVDNSNPRVEIEPIELTREGVEKVTQILYNMVDKINQQKGGS